MKAERFEVIIVIYSIVAYTVYIYTHCSYYSSTLYISYQIMYTSLITILNVVYNFTFRFHKLDRTTMTPSVSSLLPTI